MLPFGDLSFGPPAAIELTIRYFGITSYPSTPRDGWHSYCEIQPLKDMGLEILTRISAKMMKKITDFKVGFYL